jgi:hypothetical protein
MLPLLPRYQRPLTFGGVLDEAFRLFRQRWLTLVGILLVTIIPYAVLFAILGGVGLLAAGPNAAAFNRAASDPAALGALVVAAVGVGLLVGLLFAVCALASDAAGILVIDAAMRGEQRPALAALRAGLPRVPALFGSAVLLFLAVVGLAIVATPLLVISFFGLITLICLAVWAANPGARRPWLKWLMILTTPYGLVIYYGTRWALYGRAIVLERAGPVAALRRSAELVSGHWFHAWGALVALGIITGILQLIPGALIAGLVSIALFGARTTGGTAGTVLQVINQAGNLVGWVLFGGLAFAGATVLFHDLRNRREGADIAERLAAREATPTDPSLSV